MGNPSDQALVEFRITPHDIEDTVGAFQQTRQDVIDIVDRKGIIRSVSFDGTFLARAATIPGFLFRILLATEDNVFTVFTTGYQHHDRIGFIEPRQVKKIAILAKRKMCIAVTDQFRGRWQDCDGILAHHLHQLIATTFKFSGFHFAQLFKFPRTYHGEGTALMHSGCRFNCVQGLFQHQGNDAYMLHYLGKLLLRGFARLFIMAELTNFQQV